MKKKILSALMATAIMCTTLAGCKNKEPAGPVNENGDIQVELAQGEKENAAGLPTYDVGNLPVSQNICSMQQVNSIYVQQLDTRKAIAYNDLKNAILEAKESVKLSKQITEEELFHLMLILHSDDADVMYISTKYGYNEPVNGYVETIYLYYDYKVVAERRDEETIATIKNKIYKKNQMAYALAQDDGKSQTVATRRDNDFVAAQELMSIISNDYKMDSREAALTYASMCRYIGIPAIVKIGKFTSDELSEYNGTTNNGFEFLSNVTKYTTKNENGIYTVDYPTSDFVYWNLIQINGNWYNVDLKTNQYYALKEDLDIKLDAWFSFVPDYLMSMSRISKYTEDLLGYVPASTDIQYNLTYRKNNFLLTHTESQIPIRLAEVLDKIKADNKKNTIFQFEDEKTYESFIENIPQAVETYNEAYGGILLSYEVVTYKEALVVIIKNVKYKGNQ